MSVDEPGLRERKKQRTRETIVAVALRLFDERGFEQTTVADIAAAADIAPRTFFGYFPSKEDVVFSDFPEVRDLFARRLAERPDGETTVDALRAIIADIVAESDFEDETERCRRRLILRTPALRERDRTLMGYFDDLLAEAVARDLDLPADSVRPRMIAASATAALATLQAFYEDPEDPGKAALFPPEGDPLVVVDELLAFLRGGISALAERPPPAPPPARRHRAR